MLLGITLNSNLQANDTLRNKFLPDHVKVQFAGGIGFASVAGGYETKNEKFEADVFYGYVPKKIGGVTIHSLSGKLTAYPLPNFKIKNWNVKPLSVGVLLNYSFGKQYFLFDPEPYPFNYYRFPTALHSGFFVGGAIGNNGRKISSLKKLSLYYELVTYDVLLSSYFTNTKSLSLSDVFSLGLGIKTKF